MGEGFYVDPHYLYGFGDMLFAETKRDDQSSLCRMRDHTRRWCRGTDAYTGLMAIIKGAVSRYADSLYNRLDDMAAVGWGTANELQHATWVYLHKEAENSHRMDDGSYDNEQDPVAVPYNETHPELGKPTVSIDWPAMFDQFGKDVGEIDDILTHLLGFHVHREFIEDLTGDWTALANAGHALISIGDAATTVGTNIKANLAILDQHWFGAASQSAGAMLTAFFEAVAEEGPINRTIGRVYMYLADEVKKVAGKLISKLNGLVQKLKSLVPDFWDGFGEALGGDRAWADFTDFLCKNQAPFYQARTLTQNLGRLFDDARWMVDKLRDPIKEAETIAADIKVVQDSLDIVNGAVDKSTTAIAIGDDLTDMADPSEFVNAPHEQYRLPANAEAPA
jgi:hypothetical protein